MELNSNRPCQPPTFILGRGSEGRGRSRSHVYYFHTHNSTTALGGCILHTEDTYRSMLFYSWPSRSLREGPLIVNFQVIEPTGSNNANIPRKTNRVLSWIREPNQLVSPTPREGKLRFPQHAHFPRRECPTVRASEPNASSGKFVWGVCTYIRRAWFRTRV